MIEKRIMSLQEELKALNSENQKLKNKLAKDAVGDIMENVTDVKGMKVLATKIADVDMNELRNLGDQMKEKLGCSGMTRVQNNGYGQDVKHYHLHLIPRYENDGILMNHKNILNLEEVFEKFEI